MEELESNLVHTLRLALAAQPDELRMYAARLVRRYRGSHPELAVSLEKQLGEYPANPQAVLRKTWAPRVAERTEEVPVDDESGLTLLKAPELPGVRPIFRADLQETLDQLVEERRQPDRLAEAGLRPSRSAIFEGPPGVGKTLAARWVAGQLGLPLYILDLTAVMSSMLGRTGANVRAALDFAKNRPCVLFLDEIDAIAKRRNDDADIGELKRLVTVILQEVDAWPSTGLLLAATNHPELIDRALWRRFDLQVKFPAPAPAETEEAVRRFFGADAMKFAAWVPLLQRVYAGRSYSDLERDIHRIRRLAVLGGMSPEQAVNRHLELSGTLHALSRGDRLAMAAALERETGLSQRAVSAITGVSRDTLRKHRETAGVKKSR